MRSTKIFLTVLCTAQLASAQMPGGPGCGPCGPSGPATGPSGPGPFVGPDGRGEDDIDAPGYRGPREASEPGPLDRRAQEDPALARVLNQLSARDRQQLEQILTHYREGMDRHIVNNLRVTDWLGVHHGGLSNFWESATPGENRRGCEPMSEEAGRIIAPLTNQPGSSWQVYEYEYVPNPEATVSDHVVNLGGAALAGGAVGSRVGPWGALAGGLAGGGVWWVNSFEHNMVVLVNAGNRDLRVVLDPHGSQSGGPESVHGPGHYEGATVGSRYGPNGRPE